MAVRGFSSASNVDSDPVDLKTLHNKVGITSGAPEQFLKRKVKIYKPARPAGQQMPGPKHWVIQFLNQNVWTNPLMGWTSTK